MLHNPRHWGLTASPSILLPSRMCCAPVTCQHSVCAWCTSISSALAGQVSSGDKGAAGEGVRPAAETAHIGSGEGT